MKRFFNIASWLVIGIAIILWVALIWPWWIAFVFIMIRIIFLLAVSAVPKWNYYVNAIHAFETNKNQIVMTFDDGPSENTSEILNILKQYNAKATFFCIGKQIETHPKLFKRLIFEGHEVGNHTYSHSYFFGFFSKKRVMREVEMCDLVAKEKENLDLRYFRPPFGITNPMVKKALKQTNHQFIGWSKRSFDTILKDEEKIVRRLTDRIKPGDILLLHDRLKKAPRILEAVLKILEKKNLKPVTISELLNT